MYIMNMVRLEELNYLIGCFCTQLYTADGDKKAIFPIMIEDVDFGTNELARGVKFVISGVNWTMCRPGMDDYNSAISKLMQGMKEKGIHMLETVGNICDYMNSWCIRCIYIGVGGCDA